jgi:hypothetical protein
MRYMDSIITAVLQPLPLPSPSPSLVPYGHGPLLAGQIEPP